MIFKSKILFRKITLFLLPLLLSCVFYIERSIAGDSTPEATYELKEALAKKLFEKGICSNIDHCAPMSHEGSSRIYLNLYDQTDTSLTPDTVAFFIEEALNISNGIPVTFSVYPKPHDDYVNQDFFSKKDHLIQLTLNKVKNYAL